MKTANSNQINPAAGLVAFISWLAGMGKTPITGYRWRKKGWVNTVNICGRQYITSDEIERFKRRAAAGEFAKEHKVPTR